jgi:peptidoglycan/LPS O-acetylase OafA/YrhL
VNPVAGIKSDSSSTHERNFGLDVMRASAIALVIVAHFSYIFRSLLKVYALGQGCGYLGVEVFFVLSGFLIGRILITTVLARPNLPALRVFWIRRWLRTIPAYWLVLIVLLLTTKRDYRLFTFFAFLQHLLPGRRADFFGVSWSLVIEEWFYLAAPLLLLSGRRLFSNNSRSVFFSVSLLLIVGPLLARCIVAGNTDVPWFRIRAAYFLGAVPMRFDAIGYGVLMAGIRAFYPQIYASIRKRRISVTILAVLCVLGIETAITIFPAATQVSFFMRTFGLALVPAALALAVPAIESIRTASGPLKAIKPTVVFVSLTSYSIYLIHAELLGVFLPHQSDPTSWPMSIFLTIALLAVTVGMASLMYYFLERPIMTWRDRITERRPATH